MQTGPAANGVDIGRGLTVTQQRAGQPEHFATAYMPTGMQVEPRYTNTLLYSRDMKARPEGLSAVALVPVVMLLVAVMAVCIAVARASRSRLAK